MKISKILTATVWLSSAWGMENPTENIEEQLENLIPHPDFVSGYIISQPPSEDLSPKKEEPSRKRHSLKRLSQFLSSSEKIRTRKKLSHPRAIFAGDDGMGKMDIFDEKESALGLFFLLQDVTVLNEPEVRLIEEKQITQLALKSPASIDALNLSSLFNTLPLKRLCLIGFTYPQLQIALNVIGSMKKLNSLIIKDSEGFMEIPEGILNILPSKGGSLKFLGFHNVQNIGSNIRVTQEMQEQLDIESYCGTQNHIRFYFKAHEKDEATEN